MEPFGLRERAAQAARGLNRLICSFSHRFIWLAALAASITFWLMPPVVMADVASVLPAFYAEPGFHDKWRQKVSGVNEHVDPFGGSLQVSHTDMVIPGSGGLDIVIQRHY